MKKILFAAWHPGSANSLVPVIKHLRNSESEFSIYGLAYASAIEIFKREEISFQPFNKQEEVIVSSIQNIINKLKPDLILTGTSNKDKDNKEVIEQNATYAGKEMSICTLAVADIWKSYIEVFSDLENGKKFLYLPDNIAVMNESIKEAMIEEDFPESIIHVTGNPHFDNLIKLKNEFSNERKEKVRYDLCIDQQSLVIMYASQPIEFVFGGDESNSKYLGYTEKTALKELLDSLSQINKPLQGLTLLVKVHPREEQKDLEQIAQQYPCLKIVIDKSYDTKQATLASDIIISPFSTVLYESSLLDKLSISLQPGLCTDDMLITNLWGVTQPVYRKEDVKSTLEKAIHDPNYHLECAHKRQNFIMDSNATENVVNLIYKLLEKNPS